MNFSDVIERVDACSETRLRIVLRDEKQMSESALKTEGVAAVVTLPNNVCHLLAGLNADQYAAEMRAQLAASRVKPMSGRLVQAK
jgi:glucose PTS system EIICB or EIICBA component